MWRQLFTCPYLEDDAVTRDHAEPEERDRCIMLTTSQDYHSYVNTHGSEMRWMVEGMMLAESSDDIELNQRGLRMGRMTWLVAFTCKR